MKFNLKQGGEHNGVLKKKAAKLLQQFSGLPRFGKRSLICIQSNRETSETQDFFL